MTDDIEANPEGLRRAAYLFESVSLRTTGLFEKLDTDQAAFGEPWGHDDIGEKFADGDGDPEKGYISGRDNMLASVQNLVNTFDDNARNLRDSAYQLEYADDTSGDGFR